MKEPVLKEIKREFQLERMIFFSDAVFAIAITLLIIEIKVPNVSAPITEQKLVNSLLSIIPKFIGFIISFFLIGLYWRIHHSIFGYVKNYTPRLLWINLLYLFGIVLMPFSTSFFSEYFFELKKTPVIVYTINISFLGLMNFFLWRYITNPKHHLTIPLSPHLIRYRSLRAILVPIIFVCMLIWYLFSPQYAVYIPMLIPLFMYIFSKFINGNMVMFQKKKNSSLYQASVKIRISVICWFTAGNISYLQPNGHVVYHNKFRVVISANN